MIRALVDFALKSRWLVLGGGRAAFRLGCGLLPGATH